MAQRGCWRARAFVGQFGVTHGGMAGQGTRCRFVAVWVSVQCGSLQNDGRWECVVVWVWGFVGHCAVWGDTE